MGNGCGKKRRKPRQNANVATRGPNSPPTPRVNTPGGTSPRTASPTPSNRRFEPPGQAIPHEQNPHYYQYGASPQHYGQIRSYPQGSAPPHQQQMQHQGPPPYYQLGLPHNYQQGPWQNFDQGPWQKFPQGPPLHGKQTLPPLGFQYGSPEQYKKLPYQPNQVQYGPNPANANQYKTYDANQYGKQSPDQYFNPYYQQSQSANHQQQPMNTYPYGIDPNSYYYGNQYNVSQVSDPKRKEPEQDPEILKRNKQQKKIEKERKERKKKLNRRKVLAKDETKLANHVLKARKAKLRKKSVQKHNGKYIHGRKGAGKGRKAMDIAVPPKYKFKPGKDTKKEAVTHTGGVVADSKDSVNETKNFEKIEGKGVKKESKSIIAITSSTGFSVPEDDVLPKQLPREADRWPSIGVPVPPSRPGYSAATSYMPSSCEPKMNIQAESSVPSSQPQSSHVPLSSAAGSQASESIATASSAKQKSTAASASKATSKTSTVQCSNVTSNQADSSHADASKASSRPSSSAKPSSTLEKSEDDSEEEESDGDSSG